VQRTLDAAPDPVYWIDAEGRFLYANRAACAALELSRDELLARRVTDVYPDLGPEGWRPRWERLKASGALSFRAEQRSRTGRRAVVAATATHLAWDGTECAAVFSREVAEDRGTYQEFLASAGHLETIFREAPAAMALLRAADGVFLDVNPRFEALVGYRRPQLLGKTAPELELCGRDEALGLSRAVRQHGVARDRELQLRRSDGEVLETHISGVPLGFQGQDGLLTMVVDMTAQKKIERELREREERLRTVFDTSQAGIILVDPRGTITFANRRMAEMFGCTLEEVIGSSYPDHLHPEERRVGDDRMRRLIAGEIPDVHTERRYRRRDGSEFWGYLSGRRHEDPSGKLISLVGVIADITDRKRTEQEIRNSEARYRTLIDLAADAVLQGDPAGNIIGANLSATSLSGYPAEELLGMNVACLFSEDERRRAPLRYDLLQQGRAVRTERLLTRKDGSTVPVEMNSKRMPDGSYQSLFRDFSERKQAEDVLRASEEKFATAFQRAPLLMTISALEDGRYLDVNETFCEVSGFRREEVVGRTSLELGWITPTDREKVVQELQLHGRVKDLELVLTAKGGRPVHCLYSSEPITIEGTRRLLAIALDVSEKVRLQEELTRSQRLESLGVLAGGLAHDFNNILTGILGNLSVARVFLGPEHRADERLVECEKAAVRAGQLTRQLLTFARGGAPVKQAVETSRLIAEAVSFALHGSKARGVVDLAPDLQWLDADEGQINQVLNNLLINALQAMPEGGEVRVRGANVDVTARSGLTLPPGEYVRVEVEDTGDGIPRELLDKIFDPYFTTKDGGTGLGLSSVYSIVKRHGGCVQVTSTPHQGSTFIVHLPAAAARGPAAENSREEKHRPAGQGRVLVMDDEEMIRDVACQMLQAMGYQALSCPDGAAAVELYQEARERGNPWDAVILDLTVPGGMGGKEAAVQLRRIDPGVRLIVSSGYSNDPVVADCGAYGFAGAVVKPYSLQTLAKGLRQVFGEWR
jgi:PAS domain S-box-containing protein